MFGPSLPARRCRRCGGPLSGLLRRGTKSCSSRCRSAGRVTITVRASTYRAIVDAALARGVAMATIIEAALAPRRPQTSASIVREFTSAGAQRTLPIASRDPGRAVAGGAA